MARCHRAVVARCRRAELPKLAVLGIKAAPAAPRARRQRRPPALEEAPAVARRATPRRTRRSSALIWHASVQRTAVFLATQCPARSHRVKGALRASPKAIGCADPGPGAH